MLQDPIEAEDAAQDVIRCVFCKNQYLSRRISVFIVALPLGNEHRSYALPQEQA